MTPTGSIRLSAAVVGASGYTGSELVRLLAAHPGVALTHVTASSAAGRRVDSLYPALAGAVDLSFETFTAAAPPAADVVFIALPSGEAMTIVPSLLKTPARIIDLGGDFRLPSATLYEKFYGRPHSAPDLLGSAVYGLPEINKEKIAEARFVANPGCYPTGALLGILPALAGGMIASDDIVITSMSGVSGAGRSSSFDLSFTEVNENARAYKVGRHQHTPEIETVVHDATGVQSTVSFVPHLIPVTRGIYTTIHARCTTSTTTGDVQKAYATFYAHAPFVRVSPSVPQLSDVRMTNVCVVHPVVEPRTGQLIVLTVIDNLVKGAAGQAVQNMNLMFGMDEKEGLQ